MGWFNSFAKDLRHVSRLGWGYAGRHPKAWLGDKCPSVRIKGVGPMKLRYGDSDPAVIRHVFLRREYDLSRFPQHQARLQAAYDALRRQGKRPLIIDAGANIGAASIWYAKAYPEALVLAVEPDPANLDLCRYNTQSYANIRIVDGAIGARSGYVELFNDAGQSDAVRTKRSETGVRVYGMAELQALGGSDAALFLVKVDIEGFESDLFSANLEWIDAAAAIVVEPHDWMLPGQHSSRTLQHALFAHDFEMLLRRESLVFIR